MLGYMKGIFTFPFLFLNIAIGMTCADPGPFVKFPATVDAYLERIQKGRQVHAFKPGRDFVKWQVSARAALVELIGLKQMREELAGFRPRLLGYGLCFCRTSDVRSWKLRFRSDTILLCR